MHWMILQFGYTDERHVSGIYGNPTRLAHRINRITVITICYISNPSSAIYPKCPTENQ